MKLTVSLSYTQKAQEAIQDNRILYRTLGRTQINVWEYYSGGPSVLEIAEEVEYALGAAGIPDDEYEITF